MTTSTLLAADAAPQARRIAVVLFNLGGPDGPDDVRPFLENLFSDPAIIGLPGLLRRPLAAFIARAREQQAIANYAKMGGGSPLLGETRAQADALLARLRQRLPATDVRVVIAMRYWRPSIADAAAEVARFAPDQVVLAPLYPQFSTTTTASSVKAWRKAYKGPGSVGGLCCWYDDGPLARAHADRIRAVWENAGRPKVRLLFSAHGLPERIVAAGDPYQWQVEATCERIAAELGQGWDWQVCYQSRVGPLKWLGPSTPEAIAAAAQEGLGVLIDPVAFVSEHVETLVELDEEYAHLALDLGASPYLRAPTVGVDDVFIEGLADAVACSAGWSGLRPAGACCPERFGRCGRTAATA